MNFKYGDFAQPFLVRRNFKGNNNSLPKAEFFIFEKHLRIAPKQFC